MKIRRKNAPSRLFLYFILIGGASYIFEIKLQPILARRVDLIFPPVARRNIQRQLPADKKRGVAALSTPAA